MGCPDHRTVRVVGRNGYDHSERFQDFRWSRTVSALQAFATGLKLRPSNGNVPTSAAYQPILKVTFFRGRRVSITPTIKRASIHTTGVAMDFSGDMPASSSGAYPVLLDLSENVPFILCQRAMLETIFARPKPLPILGISFL